MTLRLIEQTLLFLTVVVLVLPTYLAAQNRSSTSAYSTFRTTTSQRTPLTSRPSASLPSTLPSRQTSPLAPALDQQATPPGTTATGATACFTVYDSRTCPFLNRFKILPSTGIYTNEVELERFISGQKPSDANYKNAFANDNGCFDNATDTHRYHTSFTCYTILMGSRQCGNTNERKMCRKQCNQYINSARNSLLDTNVCSSTPSATAQGNRALILSPLSSLKRVCTQSPEESDGSRKLPPADVGVCTRGTDEEYSKCGLEEDDDIQAYCKTDEGKQDSCCIFAVNDTSKRTIPKIVNPATNKFWLITAIVTSGSLLLAFIAYLITLSTNWKNYATPAARPLFRKSIRSSTAYEPNFAEKKLALDRLDEEEAEHDGGLTRDDTAYMRGGNRKSMLMDAMKVDNMATDMYGASNLKIGEGMEEQEEYEQEEEAGMEDYRSNILEEYEDQDYAIN